MLSLYPAPREFWQRLVPRKWPPSLSAAAMFRLTCKFYLTEMWWCYLQCPFFYNGAFPISVPKLIAGFLLHIFVERRQSCKGVRKLLSGPFCHCWNNGGPSKSFKPHGKSPRFFRKKGQKFKAKQKALFPHGSLPHPNWFAQPCRNVPPKKDKEAKEAKPEVGRAKANRPAGQPNVVKINRVKKPARQKIQTETVQVEPVHVKVSWQSLSFARSL